MESSAGIVLFRIDDARPVYLLLHYAGGHWDFTKGHIELGESEIAAALREAQEETGISDITLYEGFREEISYYYTVKGRKVKKSVVFFLGRTGTSKVKLSFEHVGYEWLGYEEAAKRITFRNSRDVLKKADAFLKKSP